MTDKISDHFACVASFNVLNPKIEIPKFVTKREFTERNMTNFANEFSSKNIPEIIAGIERDPNETYEIFYESLTHIRDKHMPLKNEKFDRKKHKITPWITQGIIKSADTKK